MDSKKAVKLYYLAFSPIPSRMANSIQVMRMCEAFANQGIEVILVHPFYFQPKQKHISDIWSYYGIEHKFKIVTLPTILSDWTEKIPGLIPLSKLIPYIFFGVSLLLKRRITSNDFIYGRCYSGTTFFCYLRCFLPEHLKPSIYFEVHELPKTKARIALLRKVDGLLAITNSLKKKLIQKIGIPESKILVAPDGMNLEFLEKLRLTKEDACKKLGLPLDKKIICYIGHLYKDRGIDELIGCSKYLNDDSINFLFVGGYKSDEKRYKKKIKRDKIGGMKFVGFVEPSRVPIYLFAADILIAPYTNRISTAEVMSPLKIFEYMGAKRPIISSDLPVIKEILANNHNSILVNSERPEELAQAIKSLLTNNTLASRIAQQAYLDVQNYSWQKRSEKILEFMEKASITP
jgi:glycosyltransferase involved in cell wall biosynthesis